LAAWDEQVLASQLLELQEAEFDIELLGFELPTDELQDVVEDDIPEQVEPKSKLGDVWKLGRHRLLCGDSTDKNLVSSLLARNKLNCVITDPPYGIDLDTDYSKMGAGGQIHTKVLNDDKPFDYRLFEYLDCEEQFWFGANYYGKTILDGGSWLVWDKYPTDNNDKRFGSLFELVWSKTKHKQIILRTPSLNIGHYKVEDIVHPTQKPSKLIGEIINKWTKAGDNILDLFGGSGSTLIACEQTDRTCFMMELDPKYVDVIIARWEKLTGQTAELIEG
jgi:site-specific DNA-methyltransferase (adenine-specific)